MRRRFLQLLAAVPGLAALSANAQQTSKPKVFQMDELLKKQKASGKAWLPFLEVTDLAREEGILTREETDIIHQTLEFDRSTAGSLMLPLREVTAVPVGMPVPEVLQLARDTDLNQFPVMDERGDFIGLAPAFDLLKKGQEATSLRPFLRELVRISGETKALQALQILRLHRTEIGMVTDGKGRDLGIISSYDIVQALLQPDSNGN
jgi:CBS domain containing-hemolysin-like protein